MINVAIIGATGYTALESLKILLGHNKTKITSLVDLPEQCGNIDGVFPAIKGRLDMKIEPIDIKKIAQVAEIALCCLPHTVSMKIVPELLKENIKVVDFSADYRITNQKTYEKVYQTEHLDPQNIKNAAFGLPELFRDKIKNAKLVANPGCYPTAAALALAPLLKEKIIALDDIIVNAVSGISGAGRKAKLPFHFPEINESLYAYAVGTHRHAPEIEQILTNVAGHSVKILFQPHVVGMDRGIAETIYCQPLKSIQQKELEQLFGDFYKDEPFVRNMQTPPNTKTVSFTNFCDIFATVTKGKIVVFSAIDNLIKGAAGQAVQNMNIICGIEETAGLL